MRPPGSPCVLVRDEGARTDCPFVLTDGPLHGASFRFAVHAFQRGADLPHERSVEFRAGLVAWPFPDRQPIICLLFDTEAGTYGALDAEDFDADFAVLCLYRGEDGHARLWHETQARHLARALHPCPVSDTGVYGAYVWHNRNYLVMTILV